MNTLLIFFAIPIATIILSAILETFIHCPLKVAGIFFSIFLVITFAIGGNTEMLVATIIYTILSFITAYIVNNNRRNSYYEDVKISNCNYNIDNETIDSNTITSENIPQNSTITGCYKKYR